MKEAIGLVLALALALTMAVAASADLGIGAGSLEEVQADVQAVLADLSAQFSPEQLSAAVKDGLSLLPIPADGEIDAADLPPHAGEVLAGEIAARLGIEGTDIAARLSSAMSNDFVAFLAQMYLDPGVSPPEPIIVKDGDSPVIAIAAFAILAVAGAAAFVCLKKKED